MINPETPRRIQQHVSVQEVGTETLLYDELRHQAFCLNRSSAVVWRLADGQRTIAKIREEASTELGAPVGEELVLLAIEELRNDGLIEATTMPATAQTTSRRAVLQKLGIASAMLLPAVAAIVAPTAAQAYSGCVDCTSIQSGRVSKLRARPQQRLNANPNLLPGTEPQNGQIVPPPTE